MLATFKQGICFKPGCGLRKNSKRHAYKYRSHFGTLQSDARGRCQLPTREISRDRSSQTREMRSSSSRVRAFFRSMFHHFIILKSPSERPQHSSIPRCQASHHHHHHPHAVLYCLPSAFEASQCCQYFQWPNHSSHVFFEDPSYTEEGRKTPSSQLSAEKI
jgi:hypothetical protein